MIRTSSRSSRRPAAVVPLDGGRFATSDLNDLYRRVINRNNRLQKLILPPGAGGHPPEREAHAAEAVDALVRNGAAQGDPRARQAALKSLSDMLKGKQGRFRPNLLGKR